MSTNLYCFVENKDKDGKWQFWKEFDHLGCGSRDLVNQVGIFVDYILEDLNIKDHFPNDLSEESKKILEPFKNDCTDKKYIVASDFKNMLKYLDNRLKDMIEKPAKYSSVDAYIDDQLKDKTFDNDYDMTKEDIIDTMNGIIMYLRDSKEFQSYELKLEIESLRSIIDELDFIYKSIKFSNWCIDLDTFRIMFYTI